MRIENLFQKDISRPINGVVKADQLDESSVWQELEEFVVTKELDQHLRRFFSSYCEAMEKTGDPDVAGKIGVWVSGFFGSGKSHFIKVLSYLLNNKSHTHDGQTRQAVEFFDLKVKDAMLLGDIKRAVASHTDVILFNIDSKADNRAGRNAILAVFLKVLNELAGYSGDHPHIAHMERYLEGKGRLGVFHDAYRRLTGTGWIDERDAYAFNRDEVVKALAHSLGQSEQSCEKWMDGAEGNFALTIENFCNWVQEYLDAQGEDHRIIFLVDEVGQFIGTDTHLMLNLQTITEELGTVCKGRAWVVVTSQEDIDAVLGEIQGTRANDFSKIQGRFRTRLSLSSGNVDEVIQERLLAKREEVRHDLEAEYARQGDILKNQLSFRDAGMTFPQFRDADDFVRNYPFAPYQFKLLQKIFESIRKAGATGLHLAQGERSLLDAFQHAGKSVARMEVGILVPLYRFYPSIESFLDTTVKRTIDQAKDNASLEDFDTRVLEVLFLIRYVDEVKGNVDNLVTLCLDQIDADRLALRKTIEASLQRLERETLVNRSGDTYFFLTSEERDINREIKNVELGSAEEAQFAGELVFDDVLKSGNFMPPSLFGDGLEILLTIIWMIGITNAVKFLDGVDGLATGLGLIASIFMGIVAVQTGQQFMLFLAVALVGSCLGFLPFNIRTGGPATISLGDAGSQFIGFTLAGMALMGDWAVGNPIKAYSIPVLILGIPIFDMTYITVTRIWSGDIRSFWGWVEYKGRDHLYPGFPR